MKFKKIIIGGTFDLLHIGHKALILEAFKLGEEVFIGITSDSFNRTKKQVFEKQEARVKNLEKFLKEKKLEKRAKIVLINDIYGTSLTDSKLEAILVTRETIANANLINKERIKLGFSPLKIITSPFKKDNSGKIISSSRIRNGEINSEGKIFKDLLLKIADKKLDEDTLNKFKKPFGKIVKINKNLDGNVITIGDVVSQDFLKLGIKISLFIVDLKINRVHISNWIPVFTGMTITKAKNPQSTISKELILKVEKAIKSGKNNQIILIDGEEDLVAIPAILLSPLGTKVYYGQPNVGVVEVLVTSEIKEKLLGLLGFQ